MLIHGLGGEEGCYMLHAVSFLMDSSRAVLETSSAMVRSWAGIDFIAGYFRGVTELIK